MLRLKLQRSWVRRYSGLASAIGELVMHERLASTSTCILVLTHSYISRLNEASKLLSKGADVNFPHKAIGDEGNEVAGTPLMAAAANGNQEMVSRTRSHLILAESIRAPHLSFSSHSHSFA